MAEYGLFYGGELKSKTHSTRVAARVEAFERGVVMEESPDFPGDVSGQFLEDGWEIKEVVD